MRVGYVQNNPRFGQVKTNLDRVAALVAGESFDLIVLPELFASGYAFENREEAATLAEVAGEGPVTRFMRDLAGRKNAVVIGGFAEKAGEKLFNAAALVLPDGFIRIYRKLHLFDREKEVFDQASDPFWIQETPLGRIGLMICFDWYFPESARTLALLGAEIIAHPSNLVLPNCPEAMKTRALENRVFTITANRIGRDDRPTGSLSFIGQSRIYAPKGELLAGSDSDVEEVRFAEIDPTAARTKTVASLNDLFRDRRPESYRLDRFQRSGMLKQGSVFDLLAASGPFVEYPDKMMLYGQFIGSWDVDAIWYEIGGGRRKGKGEWHFNWILGGRALQDALFATGALPHQVGTTLRGYDRDLDAWHITWMHPYSGEFVNLLGRKDGDRIVQEAVGPELRRRTRWSFTEITPRSFLWLGEVSFDDGGEWFLEQEMQAIRRPAP